jgi:hypothetical protein
MSRRRSLPPVLPRCADVCRSCLHTVVGDLLCIPPSIALGSFWASARILLRTCLLVDLQPIPPATRHARLGVPCVHRLQEGEAAPPKDTRDPEAVYKRAWDYSKCHFEYVAVAPAHQAHLLTKVKTLARPAPPAEDAGARPLLLRGRTERMRHKLLHVCMRCCCRHVGCV